MKKRAFIWGLVLGLLLIWCTGCHSKTDSINQMVSDIKVSKVNLKITEKCEPLDYLMFLYEKEAIFFGCGDSTSEFGTNYEIYCESLEGTRECKNLFSLKDRYLFGATVFENEFARHIATLSKMEEGFLLEEFSLQGVCEKQIRIDDSEMSERTLSYFIRLQNGAYFCVSGQENALIDAEGNVIKVDPAVEINAVWESEEGIIYITYLNENGRNKLCKFDSNFNITEIMEINGEILKSCDGCFYSINEHGVFSIVPDKKETIQVVNFDNLGIVKSKIRTAYIGNDIVALLSFSTGDRVAQLLQVVPRTEQEKEAIAEKKGKYTEDGKRVITIYSPYGDMSNYLLEDPRVIEEFNKQSTDYFVVLEQGSFDEIQTKLMSEEAPDLLLESSSGAMNDYSANGFLENMLPYLKTMNLYENLSTEVLNLYENEDSIYFLPQSISWYSIFVPESLTEGKTVWTTEEFLEWVERYPMLAVDRIDVLGFCLVGNMDAYINTDTMEAYFDQASFKTLLERIHRLPNSWKDNGTSMMESPKIEDGYYVLGPFSSLGYLAFEEYILGEKYVPMGYPNDKKEVKNPYAGSFGLSLLTESGCKEGAMEFVKFYLEYPGHELHESENPEYWNLGRVFTLKEFTEESKQLIGDQYEYDNELDMETILIPTTKEQVERFYQGIATMEPDTEIAIKIKEIVCEEAMELFEGRKSVDEVCKLIQDRTIIYMNEKGR